MQKMGRRFPDCKACRGSTATDRRIAWGCDAPTKSPVFTTPGRQWFRCPSSVVDEAPEDVRRRVRRAFDLYYEYDGRGVLPCAGGVVDQPSTLMEAFRCIDAEKAHWEGLLEKHREKEATRKK